MTILFKRFATYMGKNRIIRFFFGKIYKYVQKKEQESKKAKLINLMQSNGLRILKEFDQIMIENNFHYTVFAGTLLGAVREKGFIKHDCDIDTVMWERDYTPLVQKRLEEKGFKRHHRFEVDENKLGRQETYMKDGIFIDIFYIYEDKNFPTYQCDFQWGKGSYSFADCMKRYGKVIVRRIEFPLSYETKRTTFENIEVNVPANYDEWLRARYGEDYMTPNPNFKDKGDNPHIRLWTEVTGKYYEN